MNTKKDLTILGTKPISKLLLQYSLPAIIAMTASSLYNMIDSIFIGKGVGSMAISGLAVTFPLMNITTAFGALVGVGAATMISVRLGQRDYKTAQNVLGNVISLNVIMGVVISIFALIFLDPILYFFGASDNTIPYARDFMQIILLGNVVTHMYFGMNAVLRASGHPKTAMYATINTVIINTILAPIFIYLFDWGIRGAATATVTSQIISLLWQIKIFSNKKELIHFKKGTYKLKSYIVKAIISVGLSPFLMNIAACLIVILMNNSLKRYDGDYAIGAYGIVNRIIFIFVMIVMGLNQGMQPIAGYNYGAEHYGRVNEVLRKTIYCATAITSIGFLIGMFAPEMVASLFTNDKKLIEMAAEGFRIVVLFFPIIGFQMVASNFFQSIGLASKAIFLSLTRQLIILLPSLIFLPMWFGVDGIWFSMPLSDLLSSIIAAIMLIQQFKKFKYKSQQNKSL